ncbi:nucleotide-binding alpha-beta plait domain-containing protein [Tanacetum coccineum]
MGSYRSKEDDVARISTSIYVTNFPDSFSAKDLFHSCKQYGHVVDSFIPLKRSQDGKRFGFVHFINVFNVERLVNNLCTIWVDRFKFHANIARFNRAYRNGNSAFNKKETEVHKSSYNGPRKDVGTTDSKKSFVHVVKGINMAKETESIPAIVLDDECLNSKDLSNSLIGRVKEFVSLSNLKKALCNEGFDNLCVRYMGELWVLLEFDTTKAKDLFRDSVGAGSWFSVLRQASNEFTPEGRIVWVEVEGIPFKFWSGSTFKRIAAKWGELLDVDDHAEMSFHSKRLCIYTKVCSNIFENFKIVFRGKVHWVRAKEVLGWIPEFLEDEEDDDQSEQGNNDGEPTVHDMNNGGEDSDVAEVHETVFDESDGQKERQSEDPFELCPLLNKDKTDVPRKVNDDEQSSKYPPGFTPDAESNEADTNGDQVQSVNDDFMRDDNLNVNQDEWDDGMTYIGSKNNTSESLCSGRFKKSEVPRTGGSILSLMEEIVKVGQTTCNILYFQVIYDAI